MTVNTLRSTPQRIRQIGESLTMLTKEAQQRVLRYECKSKGNALQKDFDLANAGDEIFKFFYEGFA